MLHITYGSTGTFYVTTEEKRIDTSVPSSQIRLLFKFTNDMDKRVVYGYGRLQVHNDDIRTYQRSTKVTINHHTTENVFASRVNFKPFGYWKYQIYEVSYNGNFEDELSTDNSPSTETDVADDTSHTHGTVQGLVETGKLYVTETDGSEQITYTEHNEAAGTNYIWTN